MGIALAPSYEFFQPVQWSRTGLVFLHRLETDQAGIALDVSEQGIIVGQTDHLEDMGSWIKDYPHAVFWTAEGVVVDLDTMVTSAPEGLELRSAIRINEQGRILGMGRYYNPMLLRAFVFDNGVVTDLGALDGMGGTEPYDMNEQGQVVGNSVSYANGFSHAFLWKDGIMSDLHDPSVIKGYVSTAWAVNDFGAAVGTAAFDAADPHGETAALWDQGEVFNLGTLGGGYSMARDINDHGTVVGDSFTAAFEQRAFILYKGGEMIDLNQMIDPATGWVITSAYSINNSGIIVGEGLFNNGFRPVMLEPDQNGGFRIYGTGCAGSGGYVPGLYGEGFTTSEKMLSTVIVTGLGGAPGLLFFGSGYDTFPFKPGCEFQILPLLSCEVFITLQGLGAGAGTFQIQVQLPPETPPGLITLQALFLDPEGSSGFTISNPLEMITY
ncbi:MAG: hypothetical protein KJ645_02505 [Planctomycetes bacterium]|nr:hypothetical protein [Planctomycetota bacterium]